MSDTVIRVEGLGKRYSLRHQVRQEGLRHVLQDAVTSLWTPRKPAPHAADVPAAREDFWALRDVSFEVKRGDVVGIIGRNGAGKSTLLKILSRITEPTTGSIEIEGRVASLLEVGTGFHPELTGRENIYLNGAILGMSRAEIRKKFDEIVAFAEVEKFLDTPVKHYSSGMYVRLAFAVAAHLEPEILIVDEVLAVGDAQFQKKCLGKMQDVSQREGRTVLFVSHNMGAVSALCTRAILLAEGRTDTVGETTCVLKRYLELSRSADDATIDQLRRTQEDRGLRFKKISMARDRKDLFFGEDIAFDLVIAANRPFKGLSIGCSIFQEDETCVGTLFTGQTFDLPAGETRHIRLTIRRSNLGPGSYFAGFSVGDGGFTTERHDHDVVIGLPRFQIVRGAEEKIPLTWHRSWGGIVFADHELEVQT
jgi:lipopolysaccharide transport system ATP-binding protein